MDKLNLSALVVVLVAVLFVGESFVAGKCSGQWAIHACAGGNGKRSGAEPMEGSENNLNGVNPKIRFLQRLMAASQYHRDPYQERNDVMDNQDVYQNMQSLQDGALESRSIERSSFGMDDDVEQERQLAAMTAAQGSKQRPELDEQTRSYLRKLVSMMRANDPDA